MARRVRVEFEDGSGGTYSITLSGSVTRDKLMKLADLVELMSGSTGTAAEPNTDTSFHKTHRLIQETYPIGTFRSADIIEAYEDRYQEGLSPSTASTYLLRLVNRGILTRRRKGPTWLYSRLVPAPQV